MWKKAPQKNFHQTEWKKKKEIHNYSKNNNWNEKEIGLWYDPTEVDVGHA